MLAAAVSAPLASAAGGALATGAVDAPVDPRSYFQDVPTLFAPLYGEDSRETRLIEIVPGEVYALEQNLALGPLETPLRCVVVKLKDGTTWVHAPLAPTNEFFELAESVGPVKHVVVPTYALEHKIFAKPALERWPSARPVLVSGKRAGREGVRARAGRRPRRPRRRLRRRVRRRHDVARRDVYRRFESHNKKRVGSALAR
jgi:hypothetical protein